MRSLSRTPFLTAGERYAKAIERELLLEGKSGGGTETILTYVEGDREAYEGVPRVATRDGRVRRHARRRRGVFRLRALGDARPGATPRSGAGA